MLKLPVYLYTNAFQIQLDLDQLRGINNIMYQRELKIQKGIKNTVQLQFKNSDQKPVDISQKSFMFVMVDKVSQTLVLEKEIEVLDDGATTVLKGIAQLTFLESDTVDLDSVHYKFGVKILNDDGTYSPAYANTYYGVSGNLELLHDLYPVLRDSVNVPVSSILSNGDPSGNMYNYWGGNVPAHPELKSNSALHTAAFYLDRFKGTIEVQATLDNTPAAPGNANAHFVTVASTTVDTNTTGITYLNWNGVFSYVRFKTVPDGNFMSTNYYNNANQNPDNTGHYPNGKVDKVLYRC